MKKNRTPVHWMLPYYRRNPLIPQDLGAKIHSLAVAEDHSRADLQEEGVATTLNTAMSMPMAKAKAATIRSEVKDIPKEVGTGQEEEIFPRQLQPIFAVAKQATLQTVASLTYLLRLKKLIPSPFAN